jgi:hypothetical protein
MAILDNMLMCRFFLEPKCLVAGVGRVVPEITYMKSCTLLDRALKLYRARIPGIDAEPKALRLGQNADPMHALDKRPYLKGPPVSYTERVAKRCRNKTSSRKIPVDDVIEWCVQVLVSHLTDPDCPDEESHMWAENEATVAEDKARMLSCAKVAVFHRCQMPNFLVSSELSSQTLAREGKSEASSYCLAYATSSTGVRQLVPCFVKYFVLMEWGLSTSRMAAALPIPFVTDDAESESFGQTVFRFDKNVDLDAAELQAIPVDDIVRPFILVKTPPNSPRCMWRLLQFQGKLLGSFDESEYWQDE